MKDVLLLPLWFLIGFLFGWFVINPAIKYYSGETYNKEVVSLESLVAYAADMSTITDTYLYKATEFTELDNKDSSRIYLDSAILYHFHSNHLNEYLKVLNETN
jgi:hypothetical protein